MAWISNNIENLINYRISQEEYSSRLYLAMSNWLQNNGYNGASKLFKKWADEEMIHAGFSYSYLQDVNCIPKVQTVREPDKEFSGLKDIVNKAVEHEMKITEQCNELVKLCHEENDYVTLNLALKYTNEQIEEIAKTTYWEDRLNEFGDSKSSLLTIDNEMGENL